MDAENKEIPIVEDDMGEGFKEVVQPGEREAMLNGLANHVNRLVKDTVDSEIKAETGIDVAAEKRKIMLNEMATEVNKMVDNAVVAETEKITGPRPEKPKNLIRISHIKHIKEGVRAGIFIVLDPRSSDQHIGMLSSAFKIQRIRANGTVILKPVK
jgi:hypothetical protein